MRGTAQLLERAIRGVPPVEPEQLLTRLAHLQRSTTKMHQLIEEFFDLSRRQRDQRVECNRQPTDLVALARGCVTEYAQTTALDLTLSTEAETLIGAWDAARLERVLANLLTNAIKYGTSGGAIRVTVAHDPADEAEVLVVADQGVGVPAADLLHLFAPFYRGSNVAQRTVGTGIGLFGARAIVEQQGGALQLASTEAVGTTVTLRLPLRA